MQIDTDVGFSLPCGESALCGESATLPVVCGIYAKKGRRELMAHVEPGTEELT
ncbi:hypothetical protein ACWEO2_41690 [Nocardia sp. NPDC004278]